jgi:hypothetical protein
LGGGGSLGGCGCGDGGIQGLLDLGALGGEGGELGLEVIPLSGGGDEGGLGGFRTLGEGDDGAVLPGDLLEQGGLALDAGLDLLEEAGGLGRSFLGGGLGLEFGGPPGVTVAFELPVVIGYSFGPTPGLKHLLPFPNLMVLYNF